MVTKVKLLDSAVAIPSAATATTQSASDNSTKLATTAYVTTAIANLSDSAPSTLNTLNELAAALGDDANFSTTVTNSIATKLPLTGGTLTGALTMSVSPTVNNARLLVQRSNDDSSITFANNASGTPSSHAWAVGLDYSASNGLAIAYANNGIPSLTGNNLVQINTSGDVGIGTATPSTKLDVNGIASADNLALGGATVANSYLIEGVATGGNIIRSTRGSSVFAAYQSNNSHVYLGTTSNNELRLIQNDGAALTIDTSKNVGIGTTAPNQKLDVQGNIRIPPGQFLRAEDNDGTFRGAIKIAAPGTYNYEHYMASDGSNPAFFILNSTRHVGIGTSSPDRQLELEGQGIIRLNADGTSGQVDPGIDFNTEGTNDMQFRYRAASDKLAVYSYGTSSDVLTIQKADGNVGIGTTSPSANLHVEGTVKLNGNHPSGSQNVAMGDGAYAAGTGSNNTIIGHSAGNDISSSNFNTVVGAFALDAQTSGGRNVAIGYNALSSDLTGGRSTAVGWNALGTQSLSNNDISYNVAVGYDAMADNTTGTKNVAVGYACLDANTSGYNNTAVGDNALSTNQTGDQNTAIGRAALNTNTGTNNTAVGNHALIANTSADENTAVGSFALADNTTGTRNTAVGLFSLITNSTGSDNVGIGRSALQNCTAGQNTAVGSMAGDAITSGANNTAIGYEAAGKMTTGYDNTAVGRASMLDTTSGNSNTAIGVEALENNSTGNEIVAVGKHAGRNLTGSATTVIGYRAANNVTSSQESVYIGSDCAYSAGTGNRNVAIGNNAGYNWTSAYNNTNVGYNARSDEYNSYGSINLGYSVTGRGSTWVTFGHGSDYTAVAIGSTNWSSSSDERIKENIQTSTAGLSFINDLRPVTFDFKKKKDIPDTLEAYEKDSEKRHNELNPLKKHGFVAQEVKTALDNHSEVLDGSEIWSESKDGTQGVSMIAMIPMLVKALQEADDKIEDLNTRIAKLEG